MPKGESDTESSSSRSSESSGSEGSSNSGSGSSTDDGSTNSSSSRSSESRSSSTRTRTSTSASSTVTGTRSSTSKTQTDSSRTERASSSSRTRTSNSETQSPSRTGTTTDNTRSGTTTATTSGTRSGSTSATRTGTTTESGTGTGTATTETDTRTGRTKQITGSGTGTGTGTGTSSSRTETGTGSRSRTGTTTDSGTRTGTSTSGTRSGTTTSGTRSGTTSGTHTSSGTYTGTTTSGTRSGTTTGTGTGTTTSGTRSGTTTGTTTSGTRTGTTSGTTGTGTGTGTTGTTRTSGSRSGSTTSGSGSGSTTTSGSTTSGSTTSGSRSSGSTTTGSTASGSTTSGSRSSGSQSTTGSGSTTGSVSTDTSSGSTTATTTSGSSTEVASGSTTNTSTGSSATTSSGSTSTSATTTSGSSSRSSSTDSSSTTSSSTSSTNKSTTPLKSKTKTPTGTKTPAKEPSLKEPPSPFDTESTLSSKPPSVKVVEKNKDKDAIEKQKPPTTEVTKTASEKQQPTTSGKKSTKESRIEETTSSKNKKSTTESVVIVNTTNQESPSVIKKKDPPIDDNKNRQKNETGDLQKLKHGLDVIPLLDQKRTSDGLPSPSHVTESDVAPLDLNVEKPIKKQQERENIKSSSSSGSSSSSSTSSSMTDSSVTSNTSSEIIDQVIGSPTKVRRTTTPTFTVGGAEVKSKLYAEEQFPPSRTVEYSSNESPERIFGSWISDYKHNQLTMSKLLSFGYIKQFNSKGSVGSPMSVFSIDVGVASVGDTSGVYATVSVAVQKPEANQQSQHTAAYVFSESSLRFDPGERNSFLVSVPTACDTAVIVISLYGSDDCVMGWNYQQIPSSKKKIEKKLNSFLKGTSKSLSAVPLEIITKVAKAIQPNVSMSMSICEVHKYSQTYLSPLSVVRSPESFTGVRNTSLHSIFYPVPQTDEPLHIITCKLSNLSVSLPSSESLENACKSIFSEWGTPVPKGFVPQLELEILGHNGSSAVTGAIQLPLTRIKSRHAVYNPGSGKDGNSRAVTFRLPAHSKTALLFHVVWVFNNKRIAFGFHAHLCYQKGEKTTDTSISCRSTSCIKGLSISHNGLIVSDVLSSNFASPPSADFVLSNLSLSYNADITGTPETRRLKHAKKQARRDKKLGKQQSPSTGEGGGVIEQQHGVKPGKKSSKKHVVKTETAEIRRFSPDKTPLNVTKLPPKAGEFVHQSYCNGTCGGRCGLVIPQVTVPIPSVRHEVQIVSIEPESLFLLPAFQLTESDRIRLSSFPFASLNCLQQMKETIPRDPFYMPDSEFLFDFKALLNPSDDIPSRIHFTIGVRSIGQLQTGISTINKNSHFKSSNDSPCHLILGETGGHGSNVNCVIRSTPVIQSHMESGLLHVDIFNSDNGFIWGCFDIDLYRLYRHPNVFFEEYSSEIPVLDAMGTFIDREHPDIKSPMMGTYPSVKGTLAFSIISRAVPSVEGSPHRQKQPETKKRKKVIAKKIFTEGLAEDLNLHAAAESDNIDRLREETVKQKQQEKIPIPSSHSLIHFKCESTSGELSQKWPLASASLTNKHLHTVARSMDEVCGPWGVAQLKDGFIKGRAHGCIISTAEVDMTAFPFRIVCCEGELPPEDQKMISETQQHALRRARADFAKDQLLQSMAKPVVLNQQKQQPVGKDAAVFEEKLNVISRLRTKGKRKEELLKAQLHSQLTTNINCEAVAGEAVLVEVEVENRFGIGYSFRIDLRDDTLDPDSDQELTLINSLDQWKLLAQQSGFPPPPSDTVTDVSGRIFSRSEVPLPAQGKCRVPLQFLSFKDGLCGRENIKNRIIVIYIRDEDNTPRQIYQIKVSSRDSSTAVTRTVKLYGCRGETLRRWIRLGNALNAGHGKSQNYIKKDSKLNTTRKRLRIVRSSATHGCRLSSFVDYQNTTLGNLIPSEILQLEDQFADSDMSPTNIKSFLIFIYDSPDCFIPSETICVNLTTCFELSAKRNMGETSEIMIPLPSGGGDGVTCALAHGFIGENAGPGDFSCKVLHGGSYTMQGFAIAVRPVDDTPRRLLLHAMSRDVIKESYIVTLQGITNSELSSAPQTIPIPFDGKTRSFTVDFTNPSIESAPATFHAVFSPHNDIVVKPSSVTLNSSQSSVFTITLRPSDPQVYNFTLWINNEKDLTVKFCRIDFHVKSEDHNPVKLVDVH